MFRAILDNFESNKKSRLSKQSLAILIRPKLTNCDREKKEEKILRENEEKIKHEMRIVQFE